MKNPQMRITIDDLRRLPSETHWLEFKQNNANPNMIGKLISALSNSAQLFDQHFAYVIWGIRNTDHEVVGTAFAPDRQIQKGQPLELWLSQRLQPDMAFTFESVNYQGMNVVLLRIPAASNAPVEFDRTAYIRIGSATPVSRTILIANENYGANYSLMHGKLGLHCSSPAAIPS